MNILVTGGAGYIGSHMVRTLHKKHATVIVLDTMEYGHKDAIPNEVPLIVGDVGNEKVVADLFDTYHPEAVIHFAGYISVEESTKDPKKYFINNTIAPIALLSVMQKHNVDKIIFSSTAAVYGTPQMIPIPESHKKDPLSPYGVSKWCFEELLGYYAKIANMRAISLRYFNAAGASLDGEHGEAHAPETHIIPKAIQAALGGSPSFMLYGTDYPTRDGTCERDYIHIEDLSAAHMAALDALVHGARTDVYNVGTGIGITNREVLETIKKITGVDIRVTQAGRRAGDVPQLIADSGRLQKELGWSPKYSDVTTIVESAWKWHKAHPNGYEKMV